MKVLLVHWTTVLMNEKFLLKSTPFHASIHCNDRIFRSLSYACPKCGIANSQILLPLSEKSVDAQKEAKELGNQINFVKVCHSFDDMQIKN